MRLVTTDLPDVPERPGDDFDRAVFERLAYAHPMRLPTYTVQELNSLTAGLYEGYIVRCSNGDAGDPCLAYCNGRVWKVISLGDTIALS